VHRFASARLDNNHNIEFNPANYRHFDLKSVEDDPKLDKKKAARALARFVSFHLHNLAEKSEVMIEYFRAVTHHKIGGCGISRSSLPPAENQRRFDLAGARGSRRRESADGGRHGRGSSSVLDPLLLVVALPTGHERWYVPKSTSIIANSPVENRRTTEKPSPLNLPMRQGHSPGKGISPFVLASFCHPSFQKRCHSSAGRHQRMRSRGTYRCQQSTECRDSSRNDNAQIRRSSPDA
jgi:hypothetical protein